MKHALKKPDQNAIPLEVLPASSLLERTAATAISLEEAGTTEAVEAAWGDAARLAGLVKNYREQSQNKRRSAADREFARRRAKALAGCGNSTVDEQQL